MQVAENIVQFIRKLMKNWNTKLTSCGEYLAKVDNRRDIFLGDCLSPLLFVIYMLPQTQILSKVESGYTLKNEEKLNHLLLMNDSKIFARCERKVNGLVFTIQILSNDVGMVFWIKKCGVLVLKRGKVVSPEEVGMFYGKEIEEVEENRYKHLGILE